MFNLENESIAKTQRQINFFAAQKKLSQIKLNLGSGGRPISGWVNIDNFDYEIGDTSRISSKYDLKMDIRELDCEDESIDSILMVHVVEHFCRWEMVDMLKHYYKKLKNNSMIIIETPDLDKCIEWYLRGKNAPHINTPLGWMNMGKTQFYGNQWNRLDYETHRYVWTLDELVSVLKAIGFHIERANHDAIFHQKGRDMFVMGTKT
jgi:predicted SAM-dependent methyltransferase